MTTDPMVSADDTGIEPQDSACGVTRRGDLLPTEQQCRRCSFYDIPLPVFAVMIVVVFLCGVAVGAAG